MRVLLFLALSVTAALANNSYVVVAPAKVRANMDFTLSVNILQSTGPVTVTASLLKGGSSQVATGSGVFQTGQPGTIDMKLPADLQSSGYTLKVDGLGGGLNFSKTAHLTFNNKELSVFIQSDKAIYKPGDMVNFRTFATYSDLKSYTGPVDISIFDAQANKIKQWLQVSPVNGVITQELALSSQPVLGDWKISVDADGTTSEKVFTVDEYVLPKFDVTVDMPSYALTTDSDVTFTVKSEYTYGKPVKGTADVAVKLHYSYNNYDYSRDLPVTTTQVTIDGDAKVSIPMSAVKAITTSLNHHYLVVIANVTESLTGNTMAGNGTVRLYSSPVELDFIDSNPETFKPGLQYIAYLKVSQPDGLPVSSTTDKVTVTTILTIEGQGVTPTPYYWYSPPTSSKTLPDATYDVPSNGLIAIPVDIDSDAVSATVTAKFQGATSQLSLKKSYSPSSSYIQLSLESTNIKAGDPIQFKVKGTQSLTDLTYQVLSRGGIVQTGSIAINNLQESSFSITSDSSMAPNARIVVYYVRADGEIVTDSISFDISGAFINQVSIDLDRTDAEPGDDVKVTVQADPASTAFLLAIDQSVLLLKSGNDVTAEDVYSELKEYDTIDSQSSSPYLDPCPMCRRKKRMVWWPYATYYGGSDATQIFKNAGVAVITDALVFKHVEPVPELMLYRGESLTGGEPLNPVAPGVDKANSLVEPTRLRSNFADTFLWHSAVLGANGTASVTTTVPDTITSWVASAFAVNPTSGLGVSPTQAHLKVFRPFFVSLNLPYSVTRGEQVVLQAIVFNYMTTDQQVRVTLAQSTEFYNLAVDANGAESTQQVDAVQDIQVAAGEAKSVYFPIIPSQLGRIDVEVKAQSTQAADAVRRQLLVEAEGVPQEYNLPILIDLSSGQTSFSDTLDLSLPPNIVQGSEMVRVTAVGDMMGPTIGGLDSLLRMPTGCGEQTMLGLAPDVYVTDYLKSVNQLTGDIEDKALGYMESGYQRELTYKHNDGSFSAFGNSDDSGSMWLTAFVTRVFHQAKSYIFVDDNVITKALQWMINRQNPDGSFPEPGRVIHTNMQGQAGSGVGLTLFVLISLLENRDLLTSMDATTKALAYAQAEVAKTDDLYVLSMASYAFQLAGSADAQAVLNKLDAKSSNDGGLRYWHQPETTKATTGTWHNPSPTKAVDTEMTSYVLLTYTAQGDLNQGRNLIQWIAKQRNPNGGFQSTQDTVVALNAMSQFAKQVYSNNFNVQISAELSPTLSYSFNIDSSNALVLQSRESKVVPQQVKIDATGSGMSLVEVAVFFNVESEILPTTFDLTVKLVEETVNYLVLETCAKWLGDGAASGMAVQEIGIPSGFDADLESLTQLDILKRTETQNKKVILYFDEIGTTPVCLNLRAVRTGLVAKSQPAAIRVYDYYSPDNQVTGFYQSQILKDSNICDVCPDCENCV